MKRRGYSLIEMLLAISLLLVFVLIASRVTVANFATQKATLTAEGNTARFDRAVIALRKDVENSTSVSMPGPNVLRIQLPGNQTVDWQTDPQSLLRVATQKRVFEVGQSLTFTLDGSVVLLSDGTDELAMGARK